MRPWAAAALLVAAAAAWADDDGALTPEDRRAFEWFDRLGFASTAGKAFVRVRSGPHPADDRRPPVIDGFLLAQDDAASTVLTDNLVAWRVPKSEGAAVETGDLAAAAKGRLEFAAGAPFFDLEPFDDHGFEFVGKRAELIGFARHCAENGLDRAAHDLLEAARRRRNDRGDDDVRPIEEVVADDVGALLFWRFTVDFGDPSIPRPRLLREFRGYVAAVPGGPHADVSKETAELLERMVRDDDEHAKTVKPWDAMTQDERIAELIWRLRDAPGGQSMDPGRPWFFEEDRAKKPTEFARLVAFEFEAVPLLIPALEDRRLTRCVGFWRSYDPDHYVLRVGDAALQALETISHQRLWERPTTSSAMVKDGAAPAVRARVEKWWAAFQAKGERATLVEAVERGDLGSRDAYDRLAEKFPDAAEAALLRGLKTSDVCARQGLLYAAAKIRTDAMTSFLVDEALRGPTPACRAIAADACLARGRLEIVPGLIGAWRVARRGDDFHAAKAAASLLVRCGAVDAAAALGEGLDEASVLAVSALLPEVGAGLRSGPPDVVRALEDMLAGRLDDDRPYSFSRSIESVETTSRVCDLAAAGLAKAWDLPFGETDVVKARDAAIAALRAAWRTRRAAGR